MISRKSTPTRQLKYIFILMTISSLLFLYYASSSIYVNSTVFHFYKDIGEQTHWEQPGIDLTPSENVHNTTASQTSTPLNNLNLTSINSTTSFNNLSISLNSTLTTTTALERCPLIPPNIGTRIKINMTLVQDIEHLPEIKSLHLSPGGQGKPEKCQARFRVAIIIPYRDRLENMQLFLRHMHPFLSRQQLEYGIYVVEPLKNVTFNRGLLMNVGYKEAIKDTDKWDCFIFHDVDLLPEDDRNIYSCPETPRHMSSAVSTLQYKIPYDRIFGGVTGFSREHYELINGFSNLYFGWGGEDDDLRARVINSKLSVARYPLDIGRYYMAKHSKDKPNPERFKLLKASKKRASSDGISSLKYQVVSFEKKMLYTWILVDYIEIKSKAKG